MAVLSTDERNVVLGDAAVHFGRFMTALGFPPGSDAHLTGTPGRVARMFNELFTPPDFTVTTFEAKSRDMVVLRDVPFVSFCAHHWLPFTGSVSVGYIPNKKIIGLSKIPRIVQWQAAKPQVQEVLTHDVNEAISHEAETVDVAVVIRANHMCMQIRGIKSEGEMVTSALSGAFETNQQTRAEFLSLVNGRRP